MLWLPAKLLSCFSRVWLLATPWTAAYQASPSMGFSRQEYWSGVPLSNPGRELSMGNYREQSMLWKFFLFLFFFFFANSHQKLLTLLLTLSGLIVCLPQKESSIGYLSAFFTEGCHAPKTESGKGMKEQTHLCLDVCSYQSLQRQIGPTGMCSLSYRLSEKMFLNLGTYV